MNKKLIKRYLTEEEDRLLTSLKGAVDEEIITEEFIDFVMKYVKSNWVKFFVEVELEEGESVDDWIENNHYDIIDNYDPENDDPPDEMIGYKFKTKGEK